jgi:cyclopropane-fatty-acyl-phospholipid synthase
MKDFVDPLKDVATQVSGFSDRAPNRELTGLWARLLVGFLRRTIRQGTLVLILPDGTSARVGNGPPHVIAEITTRHSLRRIALNPDLALGEAYMDGTFLVHSGDIYDFVALCLGNLETAPSSRMRAVRDGIRRLVKPFLLYNPARAAQRNVAHHYDLSDELYDLFLDDDRQYSCAYFESADDTLEVAQQRKKRHIAAKLDLRAGQKVLEIGSGWGGLARSIAAENEGVHVTGLTLSKEQIAYARKQASDAGQQEQVQFHLRDYRAETGIYDRVVSVGMFEHVGTGHYRRYFDGIARQMAPDGVALVHTIGSSAGPGAPNPWIRKYIFPGGYVPSMSEVLPAIEKSGLIVTDVEVLRLHYADTLHAWRSRFLAARDQVVELYDERFCRMWDFYLASCEAAFRYNGLVVFQFQLAKRNDRLPRTRDYIAQAEKKSELAQLDAGSGS